MVSTTDTGTEILTLLRILEERLDDRQSAVVDRKSHNALPRSDLRWEK